VRSVIRQKWCNFLDYGIRSARLPKRTGFTPTPNGDFYYLNFIASQSPLGVGVDNL
jgi:hypothetical protein